MQLTPHPEIRQLQEVYDTQFASWECRDGFCEHGCTPPKLPGGVHVVAASCWVYQGGNSTLVNRVVLIRFKKRPGGWVIVRADNGRRLGWTCNNTDGGWTAHIASDAFRGSGVDSDGEIVDQVWAHLYFGNNGGHANFAYTPARTRLEAAEMIVNHLFKESAPAVGFGRHYDVKRYRITAASHYDWDGSKCACGNVSWADCPDRLELLAAEQRKAYA